MIVGDVRNCRRCPHTPENCDGINDLYVFCNQCRRIVCVVPRKRVPFKDRLTRELPRPRQDAFSQFEDEALEF
jgi:hypothetical protein